MVFVVARGDVLSIDARPLELHAHASSRFLQHARPVVACQGDAGAANPNIAYDEIVKVIVSGTPPSIGKCRGRRGDVMAGFARFTNGTLLRNAYYNGYERIYAVQNDTATILKCAQHQRIALDLTKMTYCCMPSKAPRVMPGTAVTAMTSTTKLLAPAKQSGMAGVA